MYRSKILLNIYIFSLLFLLSNRLLFAQQFQSDPENDWAYEALKLPALQLNPEKPVKIAVIDDGFRLEHNAIKDFHWPNYAEIPRNGIDDDNNGYVDDFLGWDASDFDGDPSISAEQASEFYHGTYITGVISEVLRKVYGPDFHHLFKFIPIKALADRSENTFIKDGYKAIEYAVARQADIIVCAWSGGTPEESDHYIIEKALNHDVQIIASAGNMYARKVDMPAAHNGIMAIAALDTLLGKKPSSNYGIEIDMSAPGELVRGPHPVLENSWFYKGETSAACALVSACFALLKQAIPDRSNAEILEALKFTARDVNKENIQYAGLLGAGLPNMKKAFEYLTNETFRFKENNPLLSEGGIHFSRKHSIYSWRIYPFGSYQKTVLRASGLRKADLKKKLTIKSPDSSNTLTFKELLLGYEVNSANLKISLPEGSKLPKTFTLRYETLPVDSSRLYCSETIVLKEKAGIISDGSGKQNYANNCNCYWKILAPEGFRIKIQLDYFDTQGKVDFLWLFDGQKTLPDNVIAKLSGKNTPPPLTSRSNEVLLWFVSDDQITGAGWQLKYELVK